MGERDPHGDLEVVDLEAVSGGEPAEPRRPRAARRAARRAEAREDEAPRRAGPRLGRGPRIALAVLAAAIVVLAVWGVLAWLQLTSVRDDLTAARDELAGVFTAIDEGELSEAARRLRVAQDTFASVESRVSSPLVLPARWVPGLGDDLDAVERVAAAAESVTAAGVQVTDAVDVDGGGSGALTPVDGRVPVDAIADLGRTLVDARERIAAALDDVAAIAPEGLHPSIVDARDTFVREVADAADQIATAIDLTDVIPAMFGADGPRRYVVAAANPTESRGSGGFLGAYTVMQAVEGELSFGEVVITEDLPTIPAGRLPWPDESLEERYGRDGGSGFFLNLNMTPDFPSAATAIEAYHEAQFDEPVDGVILVDPFAFRSLLELSGPVELGSYGTLTADDVVEFVTHDAYVTVTDPDERKRLIGQVATAALQGFLASPDSPPADLVGALGEMIGRESIRVHSAHPEEQEVLAALDVVAELGDAAAGDLLAVFLNSGVNYKVEYWLERHLRYEVALGPDGTAASILSAGFTNTAPTSGEPPYMIGFGPENTPFEFGEALSLVSVYCAPGCAIHERPDDGARDLETEAGTELGFGVSSTWMQLPAGQSRELIWTRTTPDAWTQEGEDRVYRLHYDHQPVVRPTTLEIVVEVPEGYELATVPEGLEVDGTEVRVEWQVDRDLDFELTFSPAP
ncbi:DUF4012 domain-containing protein [Euzebya sp.]|uniref:DUF4012 domain-containing protein n=1 Tax=Euzebya sp. TaxID=1971409 RepID=UPI003515DDE5